MKIWVSVSCPACNTIKAFSLEQLAQNDREVPNCKSIVELEVDGEAKEYEE